MGDLLSLKLHRKRKARAEKESSAAANRANFGRGKEERKLLRAKGEHEKKRLDQHKIEK